MASSRSESPLFPISPLLSTSFPPLSISFHIHPFFSSFLPLFLLSSLPLALKYRRVPPLPLSHIDSEPTLSRSLSLAFLSLSLCPSPSLFTFPPPSILSFPRWFS
ncbi:hypothetical protein J4Q44_G00122230 [Coregonus suidteri]|uniref:Uncharacterized protein n=1 Tax=Coregonus suidteri TaxID=861788 RepID=A0AAN8LTW1_9TELE